MHGRHCTCASDGWCLLRKLLFLEVRELAL